MRHDFSNRLSAIVEKLKENEKFRSDYLAMNLHDRDLIRRTRKEAIEEGISLGISQGVQQKALEDALILVRKFNVNPEKAADEMGVTLESVLKELDETAS